ncbi:MAG: bifunctional phosphoglucose/phosphomannose isomerase [FCB group bacterium]|nr:bifunctional phosphoglucose/phosphomannose isomerase [FCB group bacterium]
MTPYNYLDLKNRLDPDNMYDAIAGFPGQIAHILEHLLPKALKYEHPEYQSVLIAGMGGSAIGADLVRAFTQGICEIPVFVNRNYSIPGWVNNHSLVIASSYSGNTEETLSCFYQARESGADCIIVTTGGKLLDLAKEHQLDALIMPAGLQPRAALGYSFTTLVLLFTKLGLLPLAVLDDLNRIHPILAEYSKSLQISAEDNPARDFAEQIHNTIPAIYGSDDLTWVAALRLRGQLAENAKMMALHHHIPEQNHNEIEGWTCNEDLLKKMSIIWLRDAEDSEQIQNRMDITSELLAPRAGCSLSVDQQGETPLERLLKMIHFSDWISYYAALLNGVDPTPVDRIGSLKEKLSA